MVGPAEKLYDRRTQLRDTLVVSEATRKTMRANRSRDTVPELTLRKALWRAGLKGYRVNLRSLPGTPDVVFTRAKLAIFVHGCFWHGCPHCTNYRPPKTNSLFWAAKLEENRARDSRARQGLLQAGYSVVVIWECQVEQDLDAAIGHIRSYL